MLVILYHFLVYVWLMFRLTPLTHIGQQIKVKSGDIPLPYKKVKFP